MQNKWILRLSLSLMLLWLTACSSTHQQNLDNVDTTNLHQLERVRVQPIVPGSSDKTTLSQLRVKSLKDSAMSIGAQGGLAWASEQINGHMNQDSKYLETIFNFNAMFFDEFTHDIRDI